MYKKHFVKNVYKCLNTCVNNILSNKIGSCIYIKFVWYKNCTFFEGGTKT